MDIRNICVVGGGNMGMAIIKGIMEQGIIKENTLLIEIDDERREKIEKTYPVKTLKKVDKLIGDYETIIAAVKQDSLKQLLKDLSNHITNKNLIISVVAGISITTMEKYLEKELPIVRTMPNICAQIGEAVIGMCYNTLVSDKQRTYARSIMGRIGTVFEIDEELMDALTGLSGSGPAFVFTMVEALADGGVLMGLPRDKALRIAVETVHGSASFLKETSIHPALAIEMVASPGGTTIEGLLKLEEGGFKALVMDAVRSAAEKSKKLGG